VNGWALGNRSAALTISRHAEFIIENGNINFVRRNMAVRNFAIGIHVMGPAILTTARRCVVS